MIVIDSVVHFNIVFDEFNSCNTPRLSLLNTTLRQHSSKITGDLGWGNWFQVPFQALSFT